MYEKKDFNIFIIKKRIKHKKNVEILTHYILVQKPPDSYN